MNTAKIKGRKCRTIGHPLEAMARAYWGTQWERMSVDEKQLAFKDMRAALTALARAELPDGALVAGIKCAGASAETAELAFVGICLTLAEWGKDQWLASAVETGGTK